MKKYYNFCKFFYIGLCILSTSLASQDVLPPIEITKEQLLITAIQKSQLAQVNKLLKEGVDPNALDENGNPAIFIAIQKNSKPIAQALLKANADINRIDSDGNSILHKLTDKNFTDIMKAVIDQGFNINQKNKYGETSLLFAVRNNKKQSFDFLIKMEADINLPDSMEYTPILAAVENKNFAMVKALIEKKAIVSKPMGSDAKFPTAVAYQLRRLDILKLLLTHEPLGDAKTSEGVDLIVDSVERNRKAEMELFLQAGADPNSIASNGNPIIVIAIAKGYSTLIKPLLNAKVSIETKDVEGKKLILIAHEAYIKQMNASRQNILFEILDAGADANTKTSLDKSLLQEYIERGVDTVSKKLIAKGANLQILDNHKNALIHLAVFSGKESTLNLVLSNNTNPNMIGDRGYTPLHYAVEKSFPSIVSSLLKSNANPNIKNEKGETPLTLAIRSQNITTSKILLQAGADQKSLNEYGNPMLLEACSIDAFKTTNNTYQLLDLLIQNGADLNAKNQYGNNCLFYSINRKNIGLLEYLLKKGVDINTTDSLGNNAIHKSALSAVYDRLKNETLTNLLTKLLENGANPNQQNKQGRTALHEVVQPGPNRDTIAALQATEILLDFSADPNIRDNNNKSPQDLAESNPSEEFKDVVDASLFATKAIRKIPVSGLIDFSINRQSEIIAIAKNEQGKFLRTMTSRGMERESISIEDGDKIVSISENQTYTAGVQLGTINGNIDKKCKPNENYIVNLRKIDSEKQSPIIFTIGKIGSCAKTSVIDIAIHPSDSSILLGVLFNGKDRVLYRIGSEGELIYELRTTGLWNKIDFRSDGTAILIGDRILEIADVGKISKTLFPKKIAGLKSFNLTESGESFYAIARKIGNYQSVIVEKYKKNNSLEWRRNFSSQSWEDVTDSSIDEDGNFLLLGRTRGNLHGNVKTGEEDFFFLKLNPDGKRIFTRSFRTESKNRSIHQLITNKQSYFHIDGLDELILINGSGE
ncbi:ankyrin repeat domain-containing protein [Leptospira sp. GIMC2001]|uniref:ankyrin repeat domain-containing protein n=1 Tax=Leptospira sp. GIMC2001 TaxID=1513297 RepID=UPI00234A3D50|nr:ankyrin repeat domain-containing protein [Leptospira sp. GIMC2001]WCL49997.1 ankyrin repeat domain-containing protein [Leptospira sp. GIMC2001]